MNKKLLVVGLIFTAVAIAARLLPHMPNFVPVTALALFAGYYLPKKWSLILPMLAMLISDLSLGFYESEVMVAVYGSFLVAVSIGWGIRKFGNEKINAAMILAGSMAGSAFFFLVTNWAVWAFTQMYAKNLSGLLMSYQMGLPFLKWAFVGDLAWTAVFFGVYAIAVRFFPNAKLVDNFGSKFVVAQKI